MAFGKGGPIPRACGALPSLREKGEGLRLAQHGLQDRTAIAVAPDGKQLVGAGSDAVDRRG